jgi:class 3 adenylate cyclase/tetratricopeptide (TPR) repeat protein
VNDGVPQVVYAEISGRSQQPEWRRRVDITALLRNLGLEQYAQAFADNAIDPGILSKLTTEDLKEMGIAAVGHRRLLLEAFRAPIAGAPDDAEAAPLASVAKAEPEGDRRPVTVLFADLAGYTALSRTLDPEAVHALLSDFFDCVDTIVEDHGGRVDKHIGDCVMAVFGAPVAHSNDAERAARAALAIRDAMPALSDRLRQQMLVHVGLACGQVVASGTGSIRHREYTVTGNTVNLASRVTDAAAAGEILTSDLVQRALAGRFDGVEVDPVVAKGFAEPVRAWRLRGLRATPEHRPFVGRPAERYQFDAALEACRATNRGQTIFIRGDAGIGKTRLAEEFQNAAREAGFACHAGLVLDFGSGSGRDAIRQLVRSLIGLDPLSDPSAARAAAAAVLNGGLVTPEGAVFLFDLLDVQQPMEQRALYNAMDSPMRERGRRDTVTALVRNLSQRTSLMLLIEDLHWAGAAALAHVADLAAAVGGYPAILVLTSRTEADPLDRAWRSAVGETALTTMDLGPLRQEDAFALAGALGGASLEDTRACVERSGGHPLFLEQLLRAAREPSPAAFAAGADIPTAIQSVVLARFDALGSADRQGLRAASVLGQRFSLDTVRHLLGDQRYDCTQLVDHHLVRPQGEGFLFTHALIRDGVYSSMLTPQRQALHRRAAEWFAKRDGVLHAEHLDRAADPGAPQAYFMAARGQAAAFRYDEALQLVERSLALATERADIFELTIFKGQLLHDLGAIADSIGAYEAVLQVAIDDAERCRAWIGLAQGMRITDRVSEALTILEKAEDAATSLGLTLELARIHHLRGNLYFPLGRLDDCRREHELALGEARQVGSLELEAGALGGLGDAEYVRGRLSTAYQHLRRCIDLARANGLGQIEVANLSLIAVIQLYSGDLRDAVSLSIAAAEAAKRVGHVRAQMVALQAAGFCLFDRGEMARAKQLLEQARSLIQRLSAWRFEPIALLCLAKIVAMEGRYDEAVRLLERATKVSQETGPNYTGPWTLGTLAAVTRDAAARRAALAEGEGLLQAGCVSHNYFWFYRDAMDAAANSGDWNEVERYAAALETYTQPEPLAWTSFFVARGRALAAFGRGKRDGEFLAELRRLRSEGERLGFVTPLTMIDAALASAEAGS